MEGKQQLNGRWFLIVQLFASCIIMHYYRLIEVVLRQTKGNSFRWN